MKQSTTLSLAFTIITLVGIPEAQARNLCFNPNTHQSFQCPKQPLSKRSPPSGLVASWDYWLGELLGEYQYTVAEVGEEVYQVKEAILTKTLRPVVLLAEMRYYEVIHAEALEQVATYARKNALYEFVDSENYNDQSRHAYQDFEDRWGATRQQVRKHTTARIRNYDESPLEEIHWVYVCDRRYPKCYESSELRRARQLQKASTKALLRANALEAEATKAETEAATLRR